MTDTGKKKPQCPATIKNDVGDKVNCPGKVFNGICDNCRNHMCTKSGCCSLGHHEGGRYKNYKGTLMKTCLHWQTCGCVCHDQFTEMFKLAGMPRQAVDNSGYVAYKSTFWMPSDLDRVAARVSSNPSGPDTPRIIESPAPATVPATIARTFAPTPTGRSAPGELEAWVKEACDVWLVEQDGTNCTPARVSAEIGKKYGIKAPSVGAIDAVWNRWVRIGFAVIGKKPTRFLAYTQEGIELTLEGLKDRERRARKAAQL